MKNDLIVLTRYYPESFPEVFEFIQVLNGNLYFSADFVSYNKGDTTKVKSINSIISQDFIGSDQNMYTLIVDPAGLIALERQDYLNKSEVQHKSVSLTFDEYKLYLKQYLNSLEKVIHYINLSAQLHKEAVQDAVDIIQTKRIEFIETKDDEIDISGLLAVALSVVFFELGAAAFVLNKVFKMASKLTNAKLMKFILNNVYLLTAKMFPDSKVPRLDSLKKETKRLNNELKKYKGKIDTMPIVRNSYNENIAVGKDIKRTESKIKANDMNEEVLKNEIIEIEKKKYNESIQMGKQFVAKNKSIFRDFSEQSEEIAFKELLNDSKQVSTADLNQHYGQTVSIDVYFKTHIQNNYNEILIAMYDVKLLVKDLLLDCELYNGFHTYDIHKQFNEKFPDATLLNTIVEEYETHFNENFSFSTAKNYQTLEYEFMIWSLVLSNKYDTGGSNRIKALLSQFSRDGTLPKSPSTADFYPYSDINISASLELYLCNRFSIKRNRIILMYMLSNNYLQIIESAKSFNSDIKDNLDYRIGLLSYKRNKNPNLP